MGVTTSLEEWTRAGLIVGSAGLMFNVPWLIVWFFPGENRAPLVTLTAGTLLVGLAYMLSRTSHPHPSPSRQRPEREVHA